MDYTKVPDDEFYPFTAKQLLKAGYQWEESPPNLIYNGMFYKATSKGFLIMIRLWDHRKRNPIDPFIIFDAEIRCGDFIITFYIHERMTIADVEEKCLKAFTAMSTIIEKQED
jgi:hypothetical protein